MEANTNKSSSPVPIPSSTTLPDVEKMVEARVKAFQKVLNDALDAVDTFVSKAEQLAKPLQETGMRALLHPLSQDTDRTVERPVRVQYAAAMAIRIGFFLTQAVRKVCLS
jgi:hypothetical protein